MLASILALLLAQAAPQTARPPLSDAALAALAAREDFLHWRLRTLLLDDPAMRAEIRRVGLAQGCRALVQSPAEIVARHRPTMEPLTVAAIRRLVPEARLAEARWLSFEASPLIVYKQRVRDAVFAEAAATVRTAEAEVRVAFLERTRVLPDSRDPADTRAIPAADIAAALSMTGAYDLDAPAQLGMACAELLIPPSARPKITTTPQPPILTVVPRQ